MEDHNVPQTTLGGRLKGDYKFQIEDRPHLRPNTDAACTIFLAGPEQRKADFVCRLDLPGVDVAGDKANPAPIRKHDRQFNGKLAVSAVQCQVAEVEDAQVHCLHSFASYR